MKVKVVPSNHQLANSSLEIQMIVKVYSRLEMFVKVSSSLEMFTSASSCQVPHQLANSSLEMFVKVSLSLSM